MISVVILAGGLSRRMGTANKLLSPLGPDTVLVTTIRIAVDAIRSVPDSEVIVVTGHEQELVRGVVESASPAGSVRCVHNPDYATGMGSSIRAGAAAANPAAAVMVWPGDMPFITTDTVRALLAAIGTRANPDDAIVRPSYLGEAGHPVLFGAAWHAALRSLNPARGARSILRDCIDVPVDDPGILKDIDTPEDLP